MFESVTSSPRCLAACMIASKNRSISSSYSAYISAVAAHEIAIEGMLSISAATNFGCASRQTASRLRPRLASK